MPGGEELAGELELAQELEGVAMRAFSTSRVRRELVTLAVIAAGFAFFAGPAVADWLVTVDGSRVATRGGWKVKGRQVVFTAKNGTFSALPLSQVDLELSRRLTELAKTPPKEEKAKPKVKKKPVLVLTDKDIPRYQPSDDEPATGPDGEASAEEAADSQPAKDLRVASWKVDEGSSVNGTTLSGSLTNPTTDAAASIRLIVRVFDEDGQQVGQRYAELGRSALTPGAETTFSVTFPDVLRVGSVKFETRSARFQAAAKPVTQEAAN